MKISLWTDTEDEKQAILELTKKTFGDVEIANSAYFDWQYRSNPEGKAIVLLAIDDSKNNLLIGTNAIIRTRLLIDGKETFSFLACNAQVNSDYRKKRIFYKLLLSTSNSATNNGISSIFAFPNNNSFNSYIKEDAVEITTLPLLVRPIKPSQYFRSPIKQILKPFDIFWKKKQTFPSNIEQLDGNFDDSFETLTKKTSKRISVINSRKKEFLNWRYKDHPTRKYTIFTLKQNNELIGYIITKIHFLDKNKIGVIVDYMVNSDFKNKHHLKALVDKAISYFWDNDVSVAIVTSNKDLLENKLLHKSGFFVVPSFLKPEPLHFMVRITNDDEKHMKLTKFDNWFFSFGDYDVF